MANLKMFMNNAYRRHSDVQPFIGTITQPYSWKLLGSSSEFVLLFLGF